MRIATGGGPGAGTPGIDELDPSVITDAFGALDANGYATRSGYHFQMWLPGPTAGATPGYGEAPGGGGVGVGGGAPGPAGFPDSDNAENMWCSYAWPVRAENSGNRAFFVNDEGLIYQCQNNSAAPFSGTLTPPDFGEAYVDPADMASGLRIGTAGGNANTIWVPIQ
jgi:hypothetical protein